MIISKRTGSRQITEWQGEFGDDYVDRNTVDETSLGARAKMWQRILEPLADHPPQSILEVGANLGLNLRALKSLCMAHLIALEPNAKARGRLVADEVVSPEDVHEAIASDIPLADASVDLVFTSGVLIHIPPDDLLASCSEIHRTSKRYVLSVEYFANTPEEIMYRGQKGLLFKRDFGAFWLENFSDLKPVDYGFFWRPVSGLDNLTWWLFEKT